MVHYLSQALKCFSIQWSQVSRVGISLGMYVACSDHLLYNLFLFLNFSPGFFGSTDQEADAEPATFCEMYQTQ